MTSNWVQLIEGNRRHQQEIGGHEEKEFRVLITSLIHPPTPQLRNPTTHTHNSSLSRHCVSGNGYGALRMQLETGNSLSIVLALT